MKQQRVIGETSLIIPEKNMQVLTHAFMIGKENGGGGKGGQEKLPERKSNYFLALATREINSQGYLIQL